MAYPTAFTFRGERRSHHAVSISSALLPAASFAARRCHSLCSLAAVLRPRPFAAWSPMPPAPMSPAPASLWSTTEKSSPPRFPRPTAAFRFTTGTAADSSLWSQPRASASCRRPISTPASSTPSSATSCWSRHGCAIRSLSRRLACPRRSRKPAPQPPSLARSTWRCATDLVSVLRLMPGAGGASGANGRADLALCPRRRFRRQQNPPRRCRCRRPWQSI